MSICRDFEDELWDAAAGGAVTPQLSEHLRTCETCKRSLRALSSAVEGLAALREVDGPDPTEAVRARVMRAHRRARVAVGLAVGAVLCCSVTAAWLAVEHRSVPHTGPETRAAANRPQPARKAEKPIPTQQQVSAVAPAPETAVCMPAVVRKRHRAARKHLAIARRQKASRSERRVSLPAPKMTAEPESVIDAACEQFTMIVARGNEQPEMRLVVSDPTYRALPQPEKIIISSGELTALPGSPTYEGRGSLLPSGGEPWASY
jgi:hypothetical protein